MQRSFPNSAGYGDEAALADQCETSGKAPNQAMQSWESVVDASSKTSWPTRAAPSCPAVTQMAGSKGKGATTSFWKPSRPAVTQIACSKGKGPTPAGEDAQAGSTNAGKQFGASKGSMKNWTPSPNWGPPSWEAPRASKIPASPAAQAGGMNATKSQSTWRASMIAKQAWNSSPPVEGGGPSVYMLQLSNNFLVQESLPDSGPAIVYDKSEAIFNSAANILTDLIGDMAKSVQIHHDPDWQQFPDAGEALKQACGEEHCLALATVADYSTWAIGAAPGWKNRESTVKLALCVAIAVGTDMYEALVESYPDFQRMCIGAGLVETPKTNRKGNHGKTDMVQDAVYDPGDSAASAWHTSMEATGLPPPVHWVVVGKDSQIMQEGYPADGPAMTHDKTFQDSFSNGHQILTDLVGDLNDEVQFTHDPDWDKFPEMVPAIRASGIEDNCFCLASCPNHAAWALGFACGWKNREVACKLALAVAVAADHPKLQEVIANYPEFRRLCASQGIATGPAHKRRRKG